MTAHPLTTIVGGKIRRNRAIYCAVGAASSAAKANKRSGSVEQQQKVWCGRDGWVRWTTLQREVADAFRLWQQRRALSDDRRAHG